jgi:hypothetical protein
MRFCSGETGGLGSPVEAIAAARHFRHAALSLRFAAGPS